MAVQENKNYIFYIAGKINGDKYYKSKFADAQKHLENQGYIVLNPALLPEGMLYENYMEIGFAMIRQADGIYFLKDWKESLGARREYLYGRAYNKDIREEQ